MMTMTIMTVGRERLYYALNVWLYTEFTDDARNWCQSEDDTSPRVLNYIDRGAYFNRMEHAVDYVAYGERS
jgi:hypothetical protein